MFVCGDATWQERSRETKSISPRRSGHKGTDRSVGAHARTAVAGASALAPPFLASGLPLALGAGAALEGCCFGENSIRAAGGGSSSMLGEGASDSRCSSCAMSSVSCCLPLATASICNAREFHSAQSHSVTLPVMTVQSAAMGGGRVGGRLLHQTVLPAASLTGDGEIRL
jgi:hypothetical protein